MLPRAPAFARPMCLIAVLLLQVLPAGADDFKAGLELHGEAAMSDIGLPPYPGALAQQDREQDKSAVTLGLWGGSFGFKLLVRKFASDDDIDTVSAFYRRALGRYGTVLDCSQAPPRSKAEKREGESSKALSCSDDERKPGKRVYKVGTDEKNFRLVSLQPAGAGVHFQVLRIATQGGD